MSQSKTDSTPTGRRPEDGDLNDEQQHAGTHAPLGAPLDPTESKKVENGRKVSDSQHVTMPERSRDAAE
ncbi:hypothetical protein [Methylobacterium haplocladii]|uniref:Uncharacterized protein n=1 Tax=Methylobacterium haplocladii TaxID=1176176 RepID=A0A512IKB0_9HYPH|nr:hypothetical protein [Methylobacterium haplocladii]GEO98139.1 hypothetical protein MHA02_05270 [Methylobacterium haplocladii]GJD83615.1 hypothetical protein HPGCJGGD_1485 [Methylobacterium haplocladii]GLS60342.1 hypothetical protein GCM10007887_30210 [Methylobacterium haplocladii]